MRRNPPPETPRSKASPEDVVTEEGSWTELTELTK